MRVLQCESVAYFGPISEMLPFPSQPFNDGRTAGSHTHTHTHIHTHTHTHTHVYLRSVAKTQIINMPSN